MTTPGFTGNASLAEQRRRQLAQLLREKARQSQTVFPASPAQRGLWFMQQVDPGTYAYHLLYCVRVTSAIDSACAKSALEQLVDRHSTLRTTFRSDGHQVEMVVHGAGDADFAQIDATGWTDEELKLQAEQTLRKPFDLQNGPLVRLHVFSRTEDEHLFVLVVHHLVCDGTSLGRLLEEFMEYYQAGMAGRTPRLPPRPMDFPEFVRQQQERLAGPAGDKSKAYWLERLAGEIPQLDLPTSRPAQESNPVVSAVHFFDIDEALCRRLSALAQSCGVTLFGVLLSAYQTLLMRLSGQQDILVGVPMGGRTQPGYDGVVGHFVNLVAIRGNLSGDPTFRQFLSRTWIDLQGAIEHQEFPFSDLVRLLRPTRRFERYPLFRTCLNILKSAPGDPAGCPLWRRPESMQWGAFRIQHFPVEAQEEQYDLSIRIVETSGRLQAKLQYDSMLFDAELIEHFTRALLELLESAATDPDQPLSQLTILPPADRERLLVSWNATFADYPRDSAVHQLLAEQAARTPEATALAFAESKLSYRELDQRANQLAGYLRKQGIGRDELVAVCAERSPELVIGLLGILKAGAAYVPVDPKYPMDRVQLMLEDSGARMVLTTQGCDQFVGAITGTPRFCMDRDWPQLAAFGCDALPSITEPLDLAYVIYTSGSTGQPRGVQIPHRALVNFLCSMRDRPGLTAEDVLLSVTTFSFDIFGLELFLPLMVGARVELASADEIVDGRLLAKRLVACGATVMQATPVTWRMLLDAGFLPKGTFKALCGGEALSPDLAGRLLAAGTNLWNMYGPTETTIWSCIEPVRDPWQRTISIGRPIANTQAYVLDAHLQPAPVGVVGELYLGGDGLARGYLRRPELTAEKFIPNPFGSDGEQRIYRTGDLARFLPDGRLECVGRTDHQVKIRGFRIEMEEIEVGLRKQEGVRAAAVATQEGANGAQRLIAFVTGDFPQGIAGDALRQGLRTTLPDYMIPAQFVLLPELPLTPNGKIDRKSLPLPAWGENVGSVYVAPTDDLQRDLAEIFAEVLGVPRVGATDNFFDLGGDSLNAVALATRIKNKYGRTIKFAALFHAPTVADLADFLRDEASRGNLTLMTLRESGTKTPLFYLPGAIGTGLPFQKALEHFPSDRPIYACNIPEAEENFSALTTVREYALDVLRQIREVCQRGPFHLLGYSFGGYVAFEIAQILAEQGEKLPYLGMIDTWGPGFPSRNPLGRRVMLHIKKIRNLTPRERAEYLQLRMAKVARRATRRFRPVPAPAPAPQAPATPDPQQTFNAMLEGAASALIKYSPTPLDSGLWFYRAEIPIDDGPGLSFADPYNGWREFVTGKFEITRLTCAHDKIFEQPAVTQLAQALIDHLNQADATLNAEK